MRWREVRSALSRSFFLWLLSSAILYSPSILFCPFQKALDIFVFIIVSNLNPLILPDVILVLFNYLIQHA